MANKFSDYLKTNTTTNDEKIKVNKEEFFKDMIDKYAGYSQEQLMQEFIKMSSLKKQQGTLNQSEISKLQTTLFPYLNEEQKQKFYKLMDDVR